MANIIYPNNPFTLSSATINVNECVWRLTRGMKKAGWQTVACSDSITKVAPAANNTDSWGNNADPSLDTYPSFGSTTVSQSPWIVMRGPSTVKIPITTAPTGIPIKSEKITQGAAEGELLGYVFDSSLSTGWMVVAPRVGTFTNASTITGTISGATFTPSGTVITFVREFMFAKNGTIGNLADHQVFYICADVVGENVQLFSSLAATAGCTATIPPGCASSGTNQFPALGIVIRGIAGTTAFTSCSPFGAVTLGSSLSYHIGGANAIGSTGVTPDGSFYLAGNYGGALNLAGFAFTKVDDGDPGDCDPYVVASIVLQPLSTWSRTQNNSGSGSPFSGSNAVGGNPFIGYQARGCNITSRDIATVFQGTLYQNGTIGSTDSGSFNNRVLNHPATTPPIIMYNTTIWSPGLSSVNPPFLKMFKGRARWFYEVGLGTYLDTFSNKKYLCASTYTANWGGLAIGPWDGATTPIA